MHSLSICICALNEEKNIANTINTVHKVAQEVGNLDIEILVVDDGSIDQTAPIVRTLAEHMPSINLVQNVKNIGLGASIRKAIMLAKMEKLIFIPGDNDVPYETLLLLFRNAFSADIVMTYFQNNEIRGRSRYILSSLFKVIYTTSFDLYLIYVNGPAIYPAKILKSLDLIANRFSIIVEINIKSLRQGLTFIELPSNRQTGQEGSTSVSFVSIVEVFRVYFYLLFDIYFKNKEKYSLRPKRIDIDFKVSKI